jgi:hypothetical protein
MNDHRCPSDFAARPLDSPTPSALKNGTMLSRSIARGASAREGKRCVARPPASGSRFGIAREDGTAKGLVLPALQAAWWLARGLRPRPAS